MGAENHVFQVPQGAVRCQGLRLKHVQHGAAKGAPLQGLNQGFLVHQAAPGDVYQQSAGLHDSQPGLVQQTPGLRRQGQGQNQNVRLGQLGLQGRQGKHGFIEGVLPGVQVDAPDPATEGPQAAGAFIAHAAAAQNQGLGSEELPIVRWARWFSRKKRDCLHSCSRPPRANSAMGTLYTPLALKSRMSRARI